MFMYSYYNRRKGKSIAVYEKYAQKAEGKLRILRAVQPVLRKMQAGKGIPASV